MRNIKTALPILVGLGLMVCSSVSYGKMEYAKKEKKACTFCHAKQDSKENMPKNLTEAGKYYQSHNHSLEGYTEKK